MLKKKSVDKEISYLDSNTKGVNNLICLVKNFWDVKQKFNREEIKLKESQVKNKYIDLSKVDKFILTMLIVLSSVTIWSYYEDLNKSEKLETYIQANNLSEKYKDISNLTEKGYKNFKANYKEGKSEFEIRGEYYNHLKLVNENGNEEDVKTLLKEKELSLIKKNLDIERVNRGSVVIYGLNVLFWLFFLFQCLITQSFRKIIYRKEIREEIIESENKIKEFNAELVSLKNSYNQEWNCSFRENKNFNVKDYYVSQFDYKNESKNKFVNLIISKYIEDNLFLNKDINENKNLEEIDVDKMCKEISDSINGLINSK